MANMTLNGANVLITGAGSGIGRVCALAFARRGARILATDIAAPQLDALKREVESLGVRCDVRVTDVRDDAAMQSLADFVHGECRALDVLVNNAGIGYLGRFVDSDLAHWQRVLDINVMGVVRGCHLFLPRMLEAGGPRCVLNLSSTAGLYPMLGMAAYSASKHAVFALGEVLKMELDGTGVRVITVCPGIVNTPIVSARANVAPSVSDQQLATLQNFFRTQGCGPEVIAEAMVRAVERGDDFVTVGPHAKMTHTLRRLSLRLARTMTLQGARKMGFAS